MLLSEGQVSFQMSVELMSQWDSAPLGKNVSTHSPVWVCLLLRPLVLNFIFYLFLDRHGNLQIFSTG